MTADSYKEKERLLRRKHKLEWENLTARRELKSARNLGSDLTRQLMVEFGPDPFNIEAAELKERQSRELLALIEERDGAALFVPEDLTPRQKRFTGTVTSPLVARRLEEFIESKGMSFAEFAKQVNTTDRTIRQFRRTGKVRREIFRGIVKAIGLKPEDLGG
jgi:uncharacterized FAD-dependent dehydrogenase